MKRFKSSMIFLFFCICCMMATAQTEPFQIALEPFQINGVEGVQAFVFGQYQGKWLILGGRTDGLHRRQPWATFDSAGQNARLMVIDPVNRLMWSASLASLPTGLQEQLSSTNMEFHQEGAYLYIIGGYGYSSTAGDHITYPYLTAVKVPDVISAIENGTAFNQFFRQVTDDRFAVTGGSLNRINHTWYLTGGQRFTGRYNPMNRPTYVQEYTNSIRKFTLFDDGENLSVTHLEPFIDSINLHRRDYNVVSQIMPDGAEGLTAFSGVFQVDADLPYQNCINIDSAGYAPNNAFSQFYNHYHCAHIGLFSASLNEMHSLFFGGIAQYYDSAGTMVQNNDVPFVKTISRVTRSANGTMAEYKLPVEMPSFLGAGSEFIPCQGLPEYSNHVLKLDDLRADTTLIGYLFGGIESSAANVFWTNNGTQSGTLNQIYEIYLIKNAPSGMHQYNAQSTSALHFQIVTDFENEQLILQFKLSSDLHATVTIADALGNIIENAVLTDLSPGSNAFIAPIPHLSEGGAYMVTLATSGEKVTRKLVVEP